MPVRFPNALARSKIFAKSDRSRAQRRSVLREGMPGSAQIASWVSPAAIRSHIARASFAENRT
jgi:hypothetical protein